MQDTDRQPSRVVHCLNCGAPNPAQAVHCSACGYRLPDADPPDEEMVVEVSGGQPRVLDEETQPTGPFGRGGFQGGFTTVRLDQGRVFVTQGSRRNCLLVAIVGLLLFCCACWFLWTISARLF